MRLPNGYGSVYKLSGKRRRPWVARKTIGWNVNLETKKSQPKYRFIGYYETKKDAIQALSDYNRDYSDLRKEAITFEQVYKKWSDDLFPKRSEALAQSYTCSYRLLKPLYKRKLDDIRLDDLQAVLDDCGKTISRQRSMKVVLSGIYSYAAKHQYIPSAKAEIVKYIDLSKAEDSKKIERKVFSRKELKRLWDDGSDASGMVLMLIYTGVRINELLTLKWENVNLEKQYFYVKSSKTAAGIRDVPIADRIVPFFKHLHFGDYVISDASGHCINYDYFCSHFFSEYCPGHTPHDTRHTCASLLAEAEIDPRVIKAILGHSANNITEKVYTHISIEKKLEAINKICY